jgi:hypothetical protein
MANCLLLAMDIVQATVNASRGDQYFGFIGFIFAIVGYFWMEVLQLFFYFAIVCLNFECCCDGGTRLGPFYLGSTPSTDLPPPTSHWGFDNSNSPASAQMRPLTSTSDMLTFR